MSWIAQHQAFLQVMLNGVMVLVWVVYLQLFLFSYLRQRRPDILIVRGAGVGLQARCFVSNLGLELIYLKDIIVEIETEGGTRRALITDRTEMSDEQLSNPGEATNQGPMKSGDVIDIGSFQDLADRAHAKGLEFRTDDDVHSIEILVVALTSATSSMNFASQQYKISLQDERVELIPNAVAPKQIRSWWARRKLQRELENLLLR